jgi:hypothetical protein
MITAEGIRLGHFYDPTRTNCPCEQCHVDHLLATGESVLFLDCKYDDGEE